MTNTKTLRAGVVAGEISGDALGADLINQTRSLIANVHWIGVGGAKMQAQGLDSLIDMRRLSVMGLAEVARHLPDLLLAKRQLVQTFLREGIDAFVGIDAPDFNLRLSFALKKHGVFCAQYVSPSVWAWRQGRVRFIKDATDVALCLFPFELEVYRRHNHPAVCVGHPLTRTLCPVDAKQKAYLKQTLTKNADACAVALLPGSRLGEIARILPLFLDAFDRILRKRPDACAVLPLACAQHKNAALALLDKCAPHLRSHIALKTPEDAPNSSLSLAQSAIAASDLVLVASGTATLECALLGAPMVVAYKVNPLTYAIARRLLRTPFVALPNILNAQRVGASDPIVPEILQSQNGKTIAQSALAILNNSAACRARLLDLSQWLKNQSTLDPAAALWQSYRRARS